MPRFRLVQFALLPVFLFCSGLPGFGQSAGRPRQLPPTPFEQSNGRQTATYAQVIAYYELLDKASTRLTLKKAGPTDSGFPLHIALYSNDGTADPALWHRKGKLVILINNGIHPGEPDGVDATMALLRDLVAGRITLPDNLALAIIPLYNIGGALNRSPYFRVDQNGPDAFGSRGSSAYYDLNRDFIKSDSREARSFTEIFHWVDPEVFVDNHVSNGADYQHVMTLICSQHDKLGGAMGRFMKNSFEPGMYRTMKERGYDLIPYVNNFEDTPVSGWPEFLEGPRFSTGYASLWHSFAFMPETHMLKPYPQRVKASYDLMRSFIDFSSRNHDSILETRSQDIRESLNAARFPLQWTLDKSQYSELLFRGFEAGYKASEVSGLSRLYYDRNKPFEKMVKFYNTYNSSLFVQKPRAYVLPQGWWKVAERLQLNKVVMKQLKNDTTIKVEYYQLLGYKSNPRPFEGHHLNTIDSMKTESQEMHFRKGDWWIPMNQPANRFIAEVLEPQAMDSYFTWNFFDPILNQKEGYSAYMFEDTAAAYLKSNAALQVLLQEKRNSDTAFAKSASRQLDFVFKNSPWYEPDHNRYPVFRVMQ
ncbi:M14 family metallopeptidase [Flavihumibacter petaseus]|nr:M14 family metallopeptidase [Flavihumibacter petaseus]